MAASLSLSDSEFVRRLVFVAAVQCLGLYMGTFSKLGSLLRSPTHYGTLMKSLRELPVCGSSSISGPPAHNRAYTLKPQALNPKPCNVDSADLDC